MEHGRVNRRADGSPLESGRAADEPFLEEGDERMADEAPDERDIPPVEPFPQQGEETLRGPLNVDLEGEPRHTKGD